MLLPVKTPRSRLISSLFQSWSPLDTSKVDTSKVLELAPASDGCLGWGRMRKMVPSSLYPEKSPEDPCPSGTHSKISQYMSITHTPGALQSTVSMLCLRPIYLTCCLFNHGDLSPHVVSHICSRGSLLNCISNPPILICVVFSLWSCRISGLPIFKLFSVSCLDMVIAWVWLWNEVSSGSSSCAIFSLCPVAF